MRIPKNAKVYDTPIAKFWMGEDGIVYSVSTFADRTIENYKSLIEGYAELSQNGSKKFCVVGDITEAKPLTDEVRKYVETETAKHVRAMALVSRSTLGSAVGSVYKLLSSNPYPIATFTVRAEAIEWLNLQAKYAETATA